MPVLTCLRCLSACLQAFCARHFPAGPTWNAAGIPVSQFKPGPAAAGGGAAAAPPAVPAAAAAAGKKPGGPPPPPPPPPPGSLLQERKPAAAAGVAAGAPAAAGGGGNAMAALFADINKGASVTTGLRKVTGGCGLAWRTAVTDRVACCLNWVLPVLGARALWAQQPCAGCADVKMRTRAPHPHCCRRHEDQEPARPWRRCACCALGSRHSKRCTRQRQEQGGGSGGAASSGVRARPEVGGGESGGHTSSSPSFSG